VRIEQHRDHRRQIADPAIDQRQYRDLKAGQRLWQVEIPLAIPVIMAGVRTAVVMNIGITAIAAYIGAGGLGTLISRGISQTDPRQLIAGALAVSLLAIIADYALLWCSTASPRPEHVELRGAAR
jgi:osmoprotectant transport system permease protein